MEIANHYQTLGVAENATAEEIRLAYRRAAQVCHPDRVSDDPTAEARFKQLTSAYKVLRFPALRQAYDAELGRDLSWKPWYGALNAVDGFDADHERVQLAAGEGFERIALLLASGGFGAPRIAARLALSGCPYRTAWQIAWRARHQILQDELDRMFIQERDSQRAEAARKRAEGLDGQLPVSIDGPAAAAFAAAYANQNPSTAGTAGTASGTGNGGAMVVARPLWRATRAGRLQRLLMHIAKIIGFAPARMSRENRKLLRLEYRSPESTGG